MLTDGSPEQLRKQINHDMSIPRQLHHPSDINGSQNTCLATSR
jgi:hypothetical protein